MGASGSGAASAEKLFKMLVPQIKCDVPDMRESVIIGLGHINPVSFRSVLGFNFIGIEELSLGH